MQPAVGMNITRVVPKGGAEIDGVFLDEGTQVALNGWVLHRDCKTFGDDPDVFRPERWLYVSEEQLKLMERSMFQVCVLSLVFYLQDSPRSFYLSL